MANSRDFVDHVVELARPCGQASARAMFGGHGLYLDGRIVGLVVDDTLWLKCDAGNVEAFAERGLPPFVYVSKDGQRTLTSYRRAPEEALDGPDDMRAWLRLAQAAALRAASGKRPARASGAKPIPRKRASR